MRGVIYAGGDAPLLPVGGRPLIHHPIALLILASIRHILIAAPPPDLPPLQRALGGGENWGVNLSYAIPPAAGALGALVVASEFLSGAPVFLPAADCIYAGQSLPATLRAAATHAKGARVFTHAAGALCFYDKTAAARARALDLAAGIAALNAAYRADDALREEALDAQIAGIKIADSGALPAAAELLRAAEKARGIRPGCPAQAARRMGFIGDGRRRGLQA